jgi:hypothetical protein
MRWLCFLLVANPGALSAQLASPKPLRFDLTALAATRDSFVYRLHGEDRGWAVRQYDIRPLEMTQELVYTFRSQFRPLEEELQRVVLNRLSGEPISTYHHIDMFSPKSDTVMLEHDLEVKRGAIAGRRRIRTKSGEQKITPVDHPFPPGTVLADYMFIAAAVTNAVPGDSLGVPAYQEFADSLTILTFVAEAPTTVAVPAGRFDVLPLRSGGFRIFTTRRAPRRVVKGETLDRQFSFELVHSGPAVESIE